MTHAVATDGARRDAGCAGCRWRAVVTLVAGLLLVGPGAGVSQAAGDVDGTVSGSVFQDFGSTGIYTTGDAGAGVPRNRPIAGRDGHGV